ncbi:MAG TPA: hypothetical protein VFB31_07125 [Pseudolabrys sp.]|nr:hypothetical protein [Pseudolabrys sp.]
MTLIKALRILSSAILTGVVLVGMIGAGFTQLPFDPHWFGAGLGAIAGITLVVLIALRHQSQARALAVRSHI